MTMNDEQANVGATAVPSDGDLERMVEVATGGTARVVGIRPAAMPTNIAKALVVAQAAVVKVPHDGHNKHHDYRYTTAEAVIEAARGPMAAAGLAIVQMVGKLTPPSRITWWEQGADGPMEIVDTMPATVEVRHIITHESGDTWELPPMQTPVIPEKGRPWDKATATAGTYSLGYRLRDLLKMPRTDDADDLDRRNDDNTERSSRAAAPKTAKASPRDMAIQAITVSLTKVPGPEFQTLKEWCDAKAVKSVAAVGIEKATELVLVAADRLGIAPAVATEWITKAGAA